MELQWEWNYSIVKLPSAWSAVVENQLSEKSIRCNIGNLKLIHPWWGWELKTISMGELPNVSTTQII